MQEILIGRDGGTNTLKLTINGKSTTGGPVPQSVSREHCKVVRQDDGTAVITNLNDRNVTYVNGQAVVSHEITADDVVELGGERYRLDTSMLKLVRKVDISHLQRIWEDYSRWEEQTRISTIRSTALKSVTGLFSMAALIITFGDFGMDVQTMRTLRLVLYTLAGVSIIWTSLNMFVSAPRKVRKMKEREERFIDEYVCPACKRPFRKSYRYEKLLQLGECPMCKAKFGN
jgi:hypothetical protein